MSLDRKRRKTSVRMNLRMPQNLEVKLTVLARIEGRSPTELVKQAIAEYLERRQAGNMAYELGNDLFGKHGSGKGDLSLRRKAYLAL